MVQNTELSMIKIRLRAVLTTHPEYRELLKGIVKNDISQLKEILESILKSIKTPRKETHAYKFEYIYDMKEA